MKRLLSMFLISLSFFCMQNAAFAKVRVAFLMVRGPNKKLIRLEKNGWGFFHVAISYKGLWLHAHPDGGVQLSKNLDKFGEVIFILENEDVEEPKKKFVTSVLGLPFDELYDWESKDSYYCAKLLAGPLNLRPSPMSFQGPYWEKHFKSLGLESPPKGLGISPDKVFDQLLKKGFRPVNDAG